MLPQTNAFGCKMLCKQRVIFNCLLFLILLFGDAIANESRHTPARVLAKQTGATQFEEERYETHADCNDHKHHLKKRASDEDVDYEVYQGVVGRPGIDFPIYPRIPQTTFSCRSYGNGYFADMETDCQVFHICEEGRKISFLCPNGTIFQQSELTCDWWFKVNCLGSSGYYAESSELLSKQRVQRVRTSVPVQGFNIVGGGLNIKPKVTNAPTQRQRQSGYKPERRIDSMETPSVEPLDFDDISGEKQLKAPKTKVANSIDDETQVAAESGSLAEAGRRHNGLTSYDKPNELKSSESRSKDHQDNRATTRKSSNTPRGNSNESTERARQGYRGQQRYRDDKPTSELDRSSEESRDYKSFAKPDKILKPIVPLDVNQHSQRETKRPDIYETQSTQAVEKVSSTTASYPVGTYSTARRIEQTRSTPFYTPTVPSIAKSKTTEGKAFYIKGKASASVAATTPNPNRLANAGPVLQTTTQKYGNNKLDLSKGTTPKSIVIGMRHHYDNSPELLRYAGNNHYSYDKKEDYVSSTTTQDPISTGPTYLPKSRFSVQTEAGSAGDALLLAPNPAADESVARNLDEMLKTMNLLKNKLDDVNVEKTQSPAREGLDIPPSSGPDALVSLAQYFAGESKPANTNDLNDQEQHKSNLKAQEYMPLSKKTTSGASDATTTLTTARAVEIKSDDIRASLLSEKTVKKYSNLFGITDQTHKQQPQSSSDGLLSPAGGAKESTKEKNANFPQIGSTDATLRQLAQKPESRTIAKVFSEAIAGYLDNPKMFREQLVSVRPTDPTVVTKANFIPVTTTDASIFNHGTAASYLPTRATTIFDETTTQSSIAAEINSKFEYSTQYADVSSTTENFDTITTNKVIADSNDPRHKKLELSAELFPPTPDSGEGDEILKEEQTFSFVTPRNHITINENPKKQADSNTEKPWNISQSDFLDPLTINDALMKMGKTTTASPITYISIATKSPTFVKTPRQNYASLKIENPTDREPINEDTQQHLQEGRDSWQDIFSHYDIPVETLPSSSGLQRIANKLFGGLNESEALHLKNVMQQAEHNRQVLSLLLLLIQTCDDQNGRALERSRKHLLNALIDMDSKIKHDAQGKETYIKINTNPKISVTTYRPVTEDSFTSTTTAAGTEQTTTKGVESTTKFEIRVEDPEEDYVSTTSPSTLSTNADKRALELLKSLYSLASKFTSRR